VLTSKTVPARVAITTPFADVVEAVVFILDQRPRGFLQMHHYNFWSSLK